MYIRKSLCITYVFYSFIILSPTPNKHLSGPATPNLYSLRLRAWQLGKSHGFGNTLMSPRGEGEALFRQ